MLLLPIRIAPLPRDSHPLNRFDERDTIFSRADLEPGTSRFQGYYRRRPQNLEADRRFRREPGLRAHRPQSGAGQFLSRQQGNFDRVALLRCQILKNREGDQYPPV